MPATAPALELDLTPMPAKGESEASLRVAYRVAHVLLPARVAIRLDTLEPMLVRDTDQLAELDVSDDAGRVPMGPVFRKNAGGQTFEVRAAGRPLKGPLAVSYVMPVARAHTQKRGPHIDLQAAGGGLSGAFIGFLALPDLPTGPMQVRIHWHLPAGSRAVSSLGEGDVERKVSVSTLQDTLFLAGPVQGPPEGKAGLFAAYALGLDARDLRSLTAWAARAYEAERVAFRVTSGQPYRFFIRAYDGGPLYSGRSTDDAFMLYLPTGFDATRNDLHSLVAHELVHSLVKDLDDATGEEGDWYTEGTADYFSKTVPFAAGLYSRAEYVHLINGEAAEYYTNRLRNTDNATLASAMWSGRNAWMMPYARGALYLADLDAKLLEHGGQTTALDLVNETSARIRAGAPATAATWAALLGERVGTWATDDWKKMMAGSLLMPAPGAFGACVKGKVAATGLFDLGFATPVRLTGGSVIQGIAPGSPAQRAGLQEGDVLVGDTDINPVASSMDNFIELTVLRRGRQLRIRYAPRSGKVEAMVWEGASHATDNACAGPNRR